MPGSRARSSSAASSPLSTKNAFQGRSSTRTSSSRPAAGSSPTVSGATRASSSSSTAAPLTTPRRASIPTASATGCSRSRAGPFSASRRSTSLHGPTASRPIFECSSRLVVKVTPSRHVERRRLPALSRRDLEPRRRNARVPVRRGRRGAAAASDGRGHRLARAGRARAVDARPPGDGRARRYAASDSLTSPPMADQISFARGAPSIDIVAVDDLSAAAQRAFENDPAGSFSYGTAIGYPPLREWVAQKHELPPEQVIVTNGSMQADAFLFELLVDDGDLVVVEAPSYDRTLLSLRKRGADILAIPLEEDG